jgi:hypothetical protein
MLISSETPRSGGVKVKNSPYSTRYVNEAITYGTTVNVSDMVELIPFFYTNKIGRLLNKTWLTKHICRKKRGNNTGMKHGAKVRRKK